MNVQGRIGAEPILPAAVLGEGGTKRLARSSCTEPRGQDTCTQQWEVQPRNPRHPPQMRMKKQETQAEGKTLLCTDLVWITLTPNTCGNITWTRRESPETPRFPVSFNREMFGQERSRHGCDIMGGAWTWNPSDWVHCMAPQLSKGSHVSQCLSPGLWSGSGG